MKKISFVELISNFACEGAASIKIEHAKADVGCFRKGDIIALEVTSQQGSSFIVSVCDIFSSAPIIEVDELFRNFRGRATARYTIKRYLYVH